MSISLAQYIKSSLNAEPIPFRIGFLLEEHVVDEEAGPEQRRLSSHVQVHRETKSKAAMIQ